jgi:hypothetical protein
MSVKVIAWAFMLRTSINTSDIAIFPLFIPYPYF